MELYLFSTIRKNIYFANTSSRFPWYFFKEKKKFNLLIF